MKCFIHIITALVLVCSCAGPGRNSVAATGDVYTNPIFPSGSSPWLIRHNGHYYYTQSMNDHVSLWTADRIAAIASAKEKIIYAPEGIYHISAPQLHRIGDKWYLYFSSDDGTGSDVRHIYVMENPSADPMSGTFTMLGWIRTGHVKDIHPTTFEHRGERYLLWAGTESSHPDLVFRWNIYIARMSGPCALDSPATVISTPDYEWECQWIDETNHGCHISITFNGELRDEQAEAVEALSSEQTGVLSATTAFGKTVAAIGLIAKLQVNTLILVHTKALLDQWKNELEKFAKYYEGFKESYDLVSRYCINSNSFYCSLVFINIRNSSSYEQYYESNYNDRICNVICNVCSKLYVS